MSSVECLKLENNLCRCCHAEGCFKTLGVIIGSEGREVYADMLRDYLDVNLTPVPGPLCLVTYTICEECVQRLYDAVDFKKQILECEEKFRDMYRRDVIKACKPDLEVKVEVDTTDIPSTFVEELKVECPPETNYINENEDDTDFEFQDNVDVELDTSEETPKEQDTTKEQDSNKEENGKKKEKGKAKAVKTGKKVGRPKKSVPADGEKKTKKDPAIPKRYKEYYKIIEENCSKIYLCLICQKTRSGACSLKNHLKIQHKIDYVDCPVCKKTLINRFLLRKHLLCNHPKKEQVTRNEQEIGAKYICKYCEKEFSKRTSLHNHVSNIHKLRTCKECGLEFSRKHILYHMNEAHGVSMPTCGVCDLRFIKNDSLILHQRRVHMLEKNINCEHCSMSFFAMTDLKKHLIKHNSEKKFVCSYCNKAFLRRKTLWMHEKIHKGEKNKVCSVCNERFVQKSSLNYHMARHHPGVAF